MFISTSLVLLVILAALHFLIKVKTDNPGSFFRWGGYLVLIGAVILLLCLAYKGVRKMTHKGKSGHYGMQHRSMANDNLCSGMNDCMGKNKMECGPGMKRGMGNNACCACCGEMEMQKGKGMKKRNQQWTTDTIDRKIINKEIEIVEQ